MHRMARATAAVAAGILGGVVLGAAPAYADDADLNATGTFTAGGNPGQVDLRLRREDDGCVQVTVRLRLQLDDLPADQVAVAVNAGGQRREVSLSSEGDGRYLTEAVRPAEPIMCERRNRNATVQFLVAFGPGAPGGEVDFTGFMFDQSGQRLADGDDESRVRGVESEPTPSPTPKKSKSPSPSPTPSETEESETPVAEPTDLATAVPTALATVPLSDSGGLGLGPLIGVGVAMVAIGIALIVLLFRRRGAAGGEGAVAAGPSPWPVGGGGGGRHSAASPPTQVIPARPDYPTQQYPGMPSGPNAHRGREFPPDSTMKLPRVTE